MTTFLTLMRRFRQDESGVFAVIFGLMAIVLVALGGAVVDYVSLEQTKQRAQTALDAAALALQPQIETLSAETIRQQAEALVLERVGDAGLSVRVPRVEITRETGRLFLAGDFRIPTVFVRLVGVNELGATFASEAVRGVANLEVALALDVTASMDGQDIADLRASVNDLVNTIVQTNQSPNYSKVALVPYSQAVNVGPYATGIRGPIRAPKAVSRISWVDTSYTRTITGATRANPVTITSNGHGFANDDWVYIWDATGMTQLNARAYQVTNRAANTFQLRGVNGNNYNTYSNSNGKIRKCLNAGCQLEITSANHGYAVGEYLRLTDVGGMTGVNNVTYQVASRATNTLMLSGFPTSGAGTYTNNTGNLHCTWQNATEGCTYYYFQSSTGTLNTFAVTTCATERTPNGANDLAPTTTLMGRNYPPPNNPCLPSPIVPLSSNRTTLQNAVNALSAAGSTSGSLGILWTWYMLSPNFGYLWPFDSRPGPYNDPDTLKAAVIMTDGEFNTVHCNGVVAQNSTSGSGSTSDQINCNAPNGNPYPQARAYCDAMKATGITVYTVGFAITSGSQAAQMLNYCASNSSNAYLASNGAQLRAVFAQIARNISALRLTR